MLVGRRRRCAAQDARLLEQAGMLPEDVAGGAVEREQLAVGGRHQHLAVDHGRRRADRRPQLAPPELLAPDRRRARRPCRCRRRRIGPAVGDRRPRRRAAGRPARRSRPRIRQCCCPSAASTADRYAVRVDGEHLCRRRPPARPRSRDRHRRPAPISSAPGEREVLRGLEMLHAHGWDCRRTAASPSCAPAAAG